MAQPGVKVVGGRRLRRSMKAAGVELSELKAVHSAVARMVAEKAAKRAPHRSGLLASTVRGNNAAARSTVMAGKASVPYAAPIHWGWPARNIKAQPWISETAQDTEAQWLRMFEAGIRKAIDDIEGA